MHKGELKRLLGIFFSWRVGLFVFLFLGTFYLPLQKNFLGGGLQNYLSAPSFWSWVNFDGEHYLSIAQRGYGQGEQAFFPLYPFVVRLISNIAGFKTPGYLAFTGLVISNFSFVLALVGFYKLIRLDHKKDIAWLAIYLLILFPTAFYFGSLYTESLFLALTMWSFYLARKEKWFYASVLGGFASATRVIGVLLLPALFIEWLIQNKKKWFKKELLYLAIIPLGIFAYMYYLWKVTGDPLAFIHTLSGFGEQRSSTPIILPQVFYRYFFKILPNINWSYFSLVFTTLLEVVSAIIFLGLSVLSFFKQRLSYAVYFALGYLVPTLSGSFSSFPRYVLVLFPAFILLAEYLKKTSRSVKYFIYIIYILLFGILGVATALFVRGYWLA